MKVKIENVEEKGGQLRVHTECQYGKDNLGLSLEKKYLNPDDDKPKWLAEVKKLLGKKYNKEIEFENENPES